jgi:nucleoside-diphosphate-sugar epimerase
MPGKNKPLIALTGATGFLGSHIMAALLRKGYAVIVLGRSAKSETLEQRVTRLLGWFGMEESVGRPETVDIDFRKPRLGIPEPQYRELCARIDQIIHCASDTNFSERKRDLVFEANVSGLQGILEMAARSRLANFHYISTAYVAGVDDTLCRETLSEASVFVNVYEESKARAEKIIAAHCAENSIPLTINRPSVVYGDSRTGRSLKFSALYFPIKSLQHIKEIYLNDIRLHEGKRSREGGIALDSQGRLNLPLRMVLPRKGSINLIPVDYFAATTMAIVENSPAGGIFHLTNASPMKPETLAAYAERFMNVRGLEIAYGRAGDLVLRNAAEELFDCFIEPYRPYFSDTRVFQRTHTDAVSGGIQPPEFTYEIFERCMEFAVQVQWGKKLFSPAL